MHLAAGCEAAYGKISVGEIEEEVIIRYSREGIYGHKDLASVRK